MDRPSSSTASSSPPIVQTRGKCQHLHNRNTDTIRQLAEKERQPAYHRRLSATTSASGKATTSITTSPLPISSPPRSSKAAVFLSNAAAHACPRATQGRIHWTRPLSPSLQAQYHPAQTYDRRAEPLYHTRYPSEPEPRQSARLVPPQPHRSGLHMIVLSLATAPNSYFHHCLSHRPPSSSFYIHHVLSGLKSKCCPKSGFDDFRNRRGRRMLNMSPRAILVVRVPLCQEGNSTADKRFKDFLRRSRTNSESTWSRIVLDWASDAHGGEREMATGYICQVASHAVTNRDCQEKSTELPDVPSLMVETFICDAQCSAKGTVLAPQGPSDLLPGLDGQYVASTDAGP